MDLKKNCAKEALKYIKDNTVIGLGGGQTISYLVDFIKEEKLNVKVVTPSMKTKMLCIKNGLEVLHTFSVDKIDVEFDGCNHVDKHLNALKSGGGIHTREKIIGSMADDYILLVDEEKFEEKLSFKDPVVLEILKESLGYVERKVKELGGTPVVRCSSIKDGFTISDDGNLLLDVEFKNIEDAEKLNDDLIKICGVVETSLFTDVVTKAVIASEKGIRVISKNN